MIIWKGRGILIAFITFVFLLALDGVAGMITDDRQYYANHGWPKLMGFWLAAMSVFALRRFLGVPLLTRNEERARQDSPGVGHLPVEGELFFVRARYWPALLALLGVVFFFVRG